MDLFSSNLTDNQKLNELKEKYKTLLEVDQNGKGKFNIIKGNKKYFGNCILFILPNVSEHGFFNADYEKEYLISILDHYNITNYIITYAQPSKTHSASRKLVKNARLLIIDLLDIILPKLIVTMDEISAELFLTQKPNIITQHGTIIARHFSIPIILTYNTDYYNKRTGYEDDIYKKSILKEDWELISKEYVKRIKI